MNKPYSVRQPTCPSHNVLEGISDKWSILTLITLAEKPLHFGDLKRQLPGISAKMLTITLKKLEKYGFASRIVEHGSVIKVAYSLTPLGVELSQILQSLTHWTELNMPKVIGAMQRYSRSDPS